MKKKIIFLMGGILALVMFATPSVYAEGESTETSETVVEDEQTSETPEADAVSQEDGNASDEEITTITEEQKEESKNLLSKVIDTAFPYIKAFLLGLFDFLMDFLNIVVDFCKTHFVA